MKKYVKTKAQRRWATFAGRHGFQLLAQAAWSGEPDYRGAKRWLTSLERAGVVRQWTFEVPLSDDESLVYDVYDPDTAAPLFVAGENYDAFVLEVADVFGASG